MAYAKLAAAGEFVIASLSEFQHFFQAAFRSRFLKKRIRGLYNFAVSICWINIAQPGIFVGNDL